MEFTMKIRKFSDLPRNMTLEKNTIKKITKDNDTN